MGYYGLLDGTPKGRDESDTRAALVAASRRVRSELGRSPEVEKRR